MTTLFCDIDNTINNHFERIQRWTKNGKCNWKKAFSYKEIMKDKVLPGSIEVIEKLSTKYKIVFLTARNFGHAYKVTKDWLDEKGFIYEKIIVVKNSKEKIKYIKKEKDCLLIDDLSRKHETNPPYTILYDDVIDKLNRLKIN